MTTVTDTANQTTSPLNVGRELEPTVKQAISTAASNIRSTLSTVASTELPTPASLDAFESAIEKGLVAVASAFNPIAGDAASVVVPEVAPVIINALNQLANHIGADLGPEFKSLLNF